MPDVCEAPVAVQVKEAVQAQAEMAVQEKEKTLEKEKDTSSKAMVGRLLRLSSRDPNTSVKPNQFPLDTNRNDQVQTIDKFIGKIVEVNEAEKYLVANLLIDEDQVIFETRKFSLRTFALEEIQKDGLFCLSINRGPHSVTYNYENADASQEHVFHELHKSSEAPEVDFSELMNANSSLFKDLSSHDQNDIQRRW